MTCFMHGQDFMRWMYWTRGEFMGIVCVKCLSFFPEKGVLIGDTAHHAAG